MASIFLRAKGVTKVYPLSWIDAVVTIGRKVLGKKKADLVLNGDRVALSGVSFNVSDGERVGIIGPNGAGKSTLLQLLAGLADPSWGEIEISGNVHCVMTLGSGFREDLSGRENILIDGEMRGEKKIEMKELMNEIISFTDIGEFIDHPVRMYSSGMKARLAFSILVHVNPEILMIDEALSVGDVGFSKKASKKMRKICEQGKILMLVSHQMAALVELCTRCLWLEKGKLIKDGPPELVTEFYLENVRAAEERALEASSFHHRGAQSMVSGFEITDLNFLNATRNPKLIYNVGESITISFRALAKDPIEQCDFRIFFERDDGVRVMESCATQAGFECGGLSGEGAYEVSMDEIRLGQSTYYVRLELLDRAKHEKEQVLAVANGVIHVRNPRYPYLNPVYFPAAEWKVDCAEAQKIS